jgi:hypothetical protein
VVYSADGIGFGKYESLLTKAQQRRAWPVASPGGTFEALMQTVRKFFIVGCPRSGTTMLQQALNRHSQVAIPPETKLFFSFFGHSRDCQARHLERLNADLNIDLPTPATPIRSLAEGRAFYEEMARQYLHRLGKKGVVSFGEKTPEHTGHLDHIRQMFPAAKIILLYRDGRDVAHSLTQVPWMSSDLYVNFFVWLYYARIVRKLRNNPFPNLYLARYEDIVAAPDRELDAILRFLDLPYEQAVAEGHGNSEGIPQREYAWKSRALQKITTERVGHFRQVLTEEQIVLLERLGGRALSDLGYPLLTDGKRPLPLRFLCSLFWKLLQLVYRLPWHSLVNELFGRSLFCPPGSPARPSLSPSPWVNQYREPALGPCPALPRSEA